MKASFTWCRLDGKFIPASLRISSTDRIRCRAYSRLTLSPESIAATGLEPINPRRTAIDRAALRMPYNASAVEWVILFPRLPTQFVFRNLTKPVQNATSTSSSVVPAAPYCSIA